MKFFITLTKYNTHQRREEGNLLLVMNNFISIILYFLYIPPTGRVWHKAFFKVGLGTGPLLRHAQQFHQCFGPHQHSPKKGCLKCQMINLAPLGRWPLKFEEGWPHDVNAYLPWHPHHVALIE